MDRISGCDWGEECVRLGISGSWSQVTVKWGVRLTGSSVQKYSNAGIVQDYRCEEGAVERGKWDGIVDTSGRLSFLHRVAAFEP